MPGAGDTAVNVIDVVLSRNLLSTNEGAQCPIKQGTQPRLEGIIKVFLE